VGTDPPRGVYPQTSPTTHDAIQPTSIDDATQPTSTDSKLSYQGILKGINADPYFPWHTIPINITVDPFVSKDTTTPRQVPISLPFARINERRCLVRSLMDRCS
jgi:hypothetical protein